MNKKYINNYIKMVIIFMILISAINNATSQLNFNFIRLLFNFIENTLKIQYNLEKYFYIIVGCLAVFVFNNRNTWLPFLGPSVLPSSLIPLKTNTGAIKIIVNVKPNTKVAYWASMLSKDLEPSVFAAYGDYSNSGVVMSDVNGIAELNISQGTGYIVPSGKYIKQHIHYRELDNDLGMMGEIKTVYY